MTAEPVRIAMWSGPRNLSTALMRAWENRPDTAVIDEPLYGHYLKATGIDHPGRDAIIAAMECDWRRIAKALLAPPPPGRSIVYQKHMTHHLLPGIDRGWLDGLANAFLIREPRAVLASYVRTRERVSLDDIGLPVQVDLFEHVCRRTGRTPPVIDAADVLRDPAGTLGLLCEALGVPFSRRMLAWSPGPRPTDGVWAPHWYASVEASTGFAPYRPHAAELPADLEALAHAAMPHYRRLAEARLRR